LHLKLVLAPIAGLAIIACSPQPATKEPAPPAAHNNSTTPKPITQRSTTKAPKMFKLQVQDDENDARVWHDVKNAEGKLLTFDKEADARAKLEELFPVLVKMEQYAGPKRTRVITIIADEDDWPKKQ
jgi:methionine-rich copper-binding protein CopC